MGIEDLFEDEHPPAEPIAGKADTPAGAYGPEYEDRTADITDKDTAAEPDTGEEDSEEEHSGMEETIDQGTDTDETGLALGAAEDSAKKLDDFIASPSGYGISFNRQQWLDLLKWSHRSGVLSQEQRMQIVRMGRLIQQGRRLTKKQDEQIREMIVLVQTLGYRFS
jgi:hypothetical protein